MTDFQLWLRQTMVIERGLSVLTYAIILFFVYLTLKNAKDYRAVNRTLNIYLILLCILAYFYIPSESTDLYRWLYLTRGWNHYTIAQFYEIHLVNSTNPVAYLMMYLCRQTGITGTLPLLCGFVFFSNVFYILKDQYRNHNASAPALASALLMIMASGCFLETLSGVRCFMAFSILARCFYDELYNGKPILRNILWEVIAALIHPMCLVLLMIRIFFALFQKSERKISKVINICFAFLVAVIGYAYGIDYIESALLKAEGYTTGEETYSFLWGYFITVILMIQAFILLWSYYKRNLSNSLKNIFRFALLLFIIETVFIYEYSISHRIAMFAMIMLIPMCTQLKNAAYKISPSTLRYLNWLSVIMLFISCTRGDLSAYKFFLL